jgi:hypothetical protein
MYIAAMSKYCGTQKKKGKAPLEFEKTIPRLIRLFFPLQIRCRSAAKVPYLLAEAASSRYRLLLHQEAQKGEGPRVGLPCLRGNFFVQRAPESHKITRIFADFSFEHSLICGIGEICGLFPIMSTI